MMNLPGCTIPPFGGAPRRQRALVAVAHSILVIAYHLIQRRQPYQDLGSTYFDKRQKANLVNRLTRRLEKLGYTASVTQASVV